MYLTLADLHATLLTSPLLQSTSMESQNSLLLWKSQSMEVRTHTTYIHTYTHTTYMYIHTYTHTTYIHTYTHTAYIYTHTYYIYTHIHTYCIYIHIHTYYIYTHIHILHIYTHTHIHILHIYTHTHILHIPYSGYFSRGNIFVKVVILAISWKKIRGFGRAHAVRDAVCAFSCANISWFASRRPRKPRKYYPSKNTRYTVYTHTHTHIQIITLLY